MSPPASVVSGPSILITDFGDEVGGKGPAKMDTADVANKLQALPNGANGKIVIVGFFEAPAPDDPDSSRLTSIRENGVTVKLSATQKEVAKNFKGVITTTTRLTVQGTQTQYGISGLGTRDVAVIFVPADVPRR